MGDMRCETKTRDKRWDTKDEWGDDQECESLWPIYRRGDEWDVRNDRDDQNDWDDRDNPDNQKHISSDQDCRKNQDDRNDRSNDRSDQNDALLHPMMKA